MIDSIIARIFWVLGGIWLEITSFGKIKYISQLNLYKLHTLASRVLDFKWKQQFVSGFSWPPPTSVAITLMKYDHWDVCPEILQFHS